MKCKYSAQAHEAMMKMRKAEEETSRDENPGGKAVGPSQSQVLQQMDFAEIQKPGESSLISTVEEIDVSYLTMLTHVH